MQAYEDFLTERAQAGADSGFAPHRLCDDLFPFQRALTEWAIRKGRAAVFADCGLGKTPMQLCWADNVAEQTGKPVLILTPLAVGAQMLAESAKFHIGAARSSDGSIPDRITITNYERLHYFDHTKFGGVVCDESSILKSFDGARRNEITAFMRKVPYRLLATATAAPNDYIELGTSSEALGYLGHVDMLMRFFKNDQNNVGMKRHFGEAPKWRFKGHAELPFWRWVTSWARACRTPADLGFDDDRFHLPALKVSEHLVDFDGQLDGMLFHLPAVTMREQREERKKTIDERCEKAAALVDHKRPAIIWCHLNDEGDRLAEMIPDAVQVSGSDSDEEKERRMIGFANGEVRVLVTKPRIGAWGLNFQHCAHVVYFPSHSYEQYYQAVRRCWRFGQKRPVSVDLVMTEGERRVMENLQRKSEAADQMFSRLVAEMNHAIGIQKSRYVRQKRNIPKWLTS